MSKYISVMALALAATLSATSCHGSGKASGDTSAQNDSIVTRISHVRDALLGGTPAEIASQFSYPITRPYPLRDIEDSAQMVEYVPTLVDDSLKTIIQSVAATDWVPVGWRGWTPTDDGSILWWDGTIYAVNYISGKEAGMKEMLEREEIESLHPTLRKGWKPYYCMLATDDGTVFRIDMSKTSPSEDDADEGRMRILGYAPGQKLSELPAINLTGTMEYQGSEGNRALHFESGDTTIDLLLDSPDGSKPEVVVSQGDRQTSHPVDAIYWRDFTSGKRTEGRHK